MRSARRCALRGGTFVRMAAIDVFLSSTCYDLGDLRAELADMLRRYSFLVRVSEDYESDFRVHGHMDSIASCLLNVEASDVVVCILDRRYGPSLPGSHQYGGISATHAEIRHAHSVGKPIFTFVRDKAIADYDHILRDPSFEPKWIDKKLKDEMEKLIRERQDLAVAIAAPRSNWFDTFKNVVDLKAMVLKRLLDAFPAHAGTYARRDGRLVRLYFQYSSAATAGHAFGTFVNAGNGPALDISCGYRAGGSSGVVHMQGGLSVGSSLQAPPGQTHQSPLLVFPCQVQQSAACVWCEYSNASGERFRVEAPLHWDGSRYVRQGAEVFSTHVAGQWLPIA
jgi:hypothetical protein